MGKLTKSNAGAYDKMNTVKPRDIGYSNEMGARVVGDFTTDRTSPNATVKNDLGSDVSIGDNTPVKNDFGSDKNPSGSLRIGNLQYQRK